MWQSVIERAESTPGINGEWIDRAAEIVGQGTLARRLRRAAGEAPSRERLRAIYAELCDCLDEKVGCLPEGARARLLIAFAASASSHVCCQVRHRRDTLSD